MSLQFKTLPYAVATQCRRYEGRVAIVTGGARGLGRVVAKRLAEEGADVVLADLNEEKVKKTAQQLGAETGKRFIGLGGDLSRPGVADAIAKTTIAELGRIDVLVNNAAALIRMPLQDFSEELLQKSIDANVWTFVRATQAVLPHMLARKYGRIVNIGGEAWRAGVPMHTLLGGVGKGGMVGFTACLAGDVVRQGITVNCVSPGAFESEADGDPEPRLAGGNPAWDPPSTLAVLGQFGKGINEAGIGMGRIAHPTEVAAAVAFLGAPEASFITGQHLGASGGLAMI